MSVALRLYQQLTEAQDEKTKARLIAEAFEQLEDRYPQLKEMATQSQVREGELRLLNEIEKTRREIKEAEGKLQNEIEKTRLEIKETEGKIQKEIEKTRLEIREVEVRLQQAIHRQTFWVIGSVGTIIGFIRLLDWMLASLGR